MSIKFEVTLDTLEDWANCIHDCDWVSAEEILAYMKAGVTGSDYDAEDWSVDGKGQVAIDREVLIQEEKEDRLLKTRQEVQAHNDSLESEEC